MTKLLVSAGALALAATAVAFSAQAMPRSGTVQACLARCKGQTDCRFECTRPTGPTTANAAVRRGTISSSGNGTGNRH